MKSRNLILPLSLLANLAMAIVLLRPTPSVPTKALEEPPPSISSLDNSQAPSSEPETTAPPEKSTSPINWESVESPNYLTYIENLRSIGCPEDTIRDIITADVNKLYEQRWKEAKTELGSSKFEYWKNTAMMGGMSSEHRERYKEIDNERRATLKTLLGKEPPRTIADLAAMFNPMETMFGFLPESKQSALMELQQQMSERMMEAAEEGGNLEPEDYQRIQKEQEKAIAQLLTPSEQLEYNLRMSNSAHALRAELSGFDVTESEFRDMFALRKEFDDQYGTYGPAEGQDPQEWSQNRSASEQELKSAYKEVLGDDRYREYQHEQTLRGSSLRNIAKEFDIPREDIYQVYDATDAAQEAAQVIRGNSELSQAQQQAALDQIRLETEAQVANIIGEDAAQSYVQKGSRIRNLNQTASSQAGATSMMDAEMMQRYGLIPAESPEPSPTEQ